jgi:hypothetical protein
MGSRTASIMWITPLPAFQFRNPEVWLMVRGRGRELVPTPVFGWDKLVPSAARHGFRTPCSHT